jgi:hypothetical protein
LEARADDDDLIVGEIKSAFSPNSSSKPSEMLDSRFRKNCDLLTHKVTCPPP